MKLKALSHYGDKDTRFGDCIVGFGEQTLLVYDCGHKQHAETVENFLNENNEITNISIVISHNDADHTDGILPLLEFLKDKDYDVTVYTSLYLKSVQKIHDMLDDGRRKKNKTCEHILELFEHIAEIVTTAEESGFLVENALSETNIGIGKIVGPTEDEFVQVVAKAIEEDGQGSIDGETVMNAASVQLKVVLDDGSVLLLCGDATPEYIQDIDSYDIIQLPHHGQLADAEAIFEKLDDAYSKEYLISDNTGSAHNSGGSDKLVEKMKKDKFSPAYNTQNGVIDLPQNNMVNTGVGNKTLGVRLGDLDCNF